MRVFGFLSFALAIFSSFIIPISASAVDIPPPPPPTDIGNLTSSTIALPTPVIPFIFNPGFTTLEKRQKPTKNLLGGCGRVDVGKHNCPLMKKACFIFFEANFPPGDMRRVRYKDLCKRWICAQTYGDCSPNSCNWCP